MNDFNVINASESHLIFIDSLQKKNAEALSFYPKQVFEREVNNGRILLGLLNGDPCGYIYVGARKPDVKCHQVCIQYDARRRLYGAALVQALEDYSRGCYTITLRCGFDLEANDFWKAMGYNCIDIQQGGIRRMRKINVWRKQLIPELFPDLQLSPAVGKTDASAWRKRDKNKFSSQFSRGEKLKQYREEIINTNHNT
tara:strand:+ start:2596 stop:3189 length:594 start_codon:yes stop_codon:yes gene_type:complete